MSLRCMYLEYPISSLEQLSGNPYEIEQFVPLFNLLIFKLIQSRTTCSDMNGQTKGSSV